MTRTTITVTTPAELIETIPAQLGYEPTESYVLIGLTKAGTMHGIACTALPASPQEMDQIATTAKMFDPLLRASDSAILLVWSKVATATQITELRAALAPLEARHHLTIAATWQVTSEVSIQFHDGQGIDITPRAASAIDLGPLALHPHPSRDALVAELSAAPGATLGHIPTHAEPAALSALWLDLLTGRLRAAECTPDDLGRIIAASHLAQLRDLTYAATIAGVATTLGVETSFSYDPIDAAAITDHLYALAHHLPDLPPAIEALHMIAYVALGTGHWTHARILTERIVDIDPTRAAAQALLECLTQGINPLTGS